MSAVLREIPGVRQDQAAVTRRWFQDDYFDLFVWIGSADEPVSFQLCYNRLKTERVLGWSRESGYMHCGVDDGESLPIKNMTPIYVADGLLPVTRLESEFEQLSARVDARVRRFVLEKIREVAHHVPSHAGTSMR
ncbi:MAG: hypothetical protein ACREUQ_00265 [Burkholderiales bacterium]